MRILVAGGTGFLGASVTSRLVSTSGLEVMVLSRSMGERPTPGASYVEGDWSEAYREPTIAAFRPDVLVNMVGSSHPRSSIGCEVAEVERNLLPLLRLIEVLEPIGLQKIIFTSSAGAIYQAGDCRVEKKQIDTPYLATKLSVEHYLSCWAANSGITTASLRISNAIGRSQKSNFGIVGHFAEAIADQRGVEFVGDYEVAKDYVPLQDVVEAVTAATLSDLTPGAHVVDIGSGWSLDAKGMYKLISQLVDAPSHVAWQPHELGMVPSALRLQPAYRLMGWEPRNSVVEAIWGTCQEVMK